MKLPAPTKYGSFGGGPPAMMRSCRIRAPPWHVGNNPLLFWGLQVRGGLRAASLPRRVEAAASHDMEQ